MERPFICKCLTAEYEEEKSVLRGPVHIQFDIGKEQLFHVDIEQAVIRSIKISTDSDVSIFDLNTVLSKIERLLMLLDGRFIQLKEMKFSESDVFSNDSLIPCAQNLIAQRSSYFCSADFCKNASYRLIDFENVFTPDLFSKWDDLLDELGVVHQMFLYSVSDSKITIDVKCAFLVELAEPILKEGKLLSPLIVWNNILVDGHNRYEIVQEHPEISFSTMPLPFESREEVLAWICKNQLGRRNLTPEQKYYLMGKQYEAEKAAHGGDRKSSDAKSSSLNANLIDSTKTCDRIAEENGVSKDTVIRASKYMKGVEIAEELMPGLKQSILSGQMKVSKADMHRLARAAYNDRAQTLQDILHPELKVEPKPDADGVIRVPGKAPVMPFRKFESIYDSDAYPEDLRYRYVALEDVTTRFRIAFNYQLEQMPDNAQRDVILEIIHKHKDYLASLEAALADVKDQTA